MAVVFTPYIGVKLLPNFAKNGESRDGPHPRPIYEARVYRGLRRVIDWCVRRRLAVVARHRRCCSSARSSAFTSWCSSSSFRCRTRPELFLRAAPARGRRRSPLRRKRQESGSAAEGRQGYRHATPPISAGVRRASGSASIRNCRSESFAQTVIVSKDVKARERIKARLEKARGRRRAVGGARTRGSLRSSVRRWATRSSSASSAPTPLTVRDIAYRGARGHARQNPRSSIRISTGTSRRRR